MKRKQTRAIFIRGFRLEKKPRRKCRQEGWGAAIYCLHTEMSFKLETKRKIQQSRKTNTNSCIN